MLGGGPCLLYCDTYIACAMCDLGMAVTLVVGKTFFLTPVSGIVAALAVME